ncbi:type II secretion system protein [Fontivita pretiosa]|uniref:type II secretion system protein n=1 Tax=Fontivita pretiosa TaxID=2989684 RepID=UPI003D16F61E
MLRQRSMNRSPSVNAWFGFTLVELLVVIGVLGVLMGVLLPVLARARRCAKHVQLLCGLREMLAGYTQYQLENRGAVLFGYTPPTVDGVPVTVTDPVSGQVFGMPIADRYPWRLAPYVSNLWRILHMHGQTPPQPQPGDPPDVAMTKAYALSLNPTFGINSVYLGGHAGVFEGFVGASGDQPNVGKHVVFRAGEVRRPSQLIVFAESQMRNGPGGDPQTGLHFVTPPRAAGQRWKVVNGRFVLTSSMISGLPQGRFSDRAAVGFFDGHVESLLPVELGDMRLWANRADRPDYDFVAGRSMAQ